jgi:hypothetical protein
VTETLTGSVETLLTLAKNMIIIKSISSVFKNKHLKELENILESDPFIIHYSCRAIGSNEPKNLKITGITIQYYKNEDKCQNYDYEDEKQSDEEEQKFLENFFTELSQNHSKNVLCWHVNSKDYGIEHLKSRYFELTKKQVNFNNRFYSIPTFLEKIYPKEFEKLSHPRMENLFKVNGLNFENFLSGKEEGKEINPYKLRCSRQRKVSNFYFVIGKVLRKELKF